MGEFVNFAAGTITDSPLTVGATTVNSAAFATTLPVIAAPHTMYLTLDPGAVGGIPEIVTVTAHTASATTVTVVRGQQTSLGGSAARSHAAATTWALGVTAFDLNRASGDPGDLKVGIWTTPPTGWLLMGQAVTTADTRYPALWAVAPASWKSGTTLNLPSMDGRTLFGGGTLGAVGGANTHTLVTANLPAHTHAIDHDHALATSSSGGGHNHTINVRDNSVPGNTSFVASAASTGVASTLATTTDGAHTHSFDVPTLTGLSGSTGTGTAVDHAPAHLRINVAIKT